MDPRQIDNAVEKHIPTVRIIALGFAASVLLYVGVAYLLIGGLGHQPIMEVPFFMAAAIAVSQLLTILAGWLISLAMRRPGRARGVSSASPGSADATGSEVGRDEAMQRYIKSLVVAAALRELASIVGLALTLLTADMTWVLLLGGTALISMFVHWPRRAAIEDFLQQQGSAR